MVERKHKIVGADGRSRECNSIERGLSYQRFPNEISPRIKRTCRQPEERRKKRKKGIEEITHNLHYHWKGDGTDVLFGNYG
jgi:hypothetical protein